MNVMIPYIPTILWTITDPKLLATLRGAVVIKEEPNKLARALNQGDE